MKFGINRAINRLVNRVVVVGAGVALAASVVILVGSLATLKEEQAFLANRVVSMEAEVKRVRARRAALEEELRVARASVGVDVAECRREMDSVKNQMVRARALGERTRVRLEKLGAMLRNGNEEVSQLLLEITRDN